MGSAKLKVLLCMAVALVMCFSSVGAMACTAIYVGSDLTEDGSTMFARSEDISNSYNKLFYVSPTPLGKNTAAAMVLLTPLPTIATATPLSAMTMATRWKAFAPIAAARINIRPMRRLAPTRWA